MASIDLRLARLLDGPHLARLVPQLAPETLHQLILYRGLDACGELITAATPAQLTSVLDLDLWRHAESGHAERFDEERFGEWLELLVEAGGSVAARTVAAIDEDLVITGLARYVRVFDPAAFVSSSALACDVGGFQIRPNRTDAWDAIVTLLVALDADHHDYFQQVMRGCRRLSNSAPEPSGFDDLLLAPDQLLHDVGLAREHRRSRLGYLTPAEARTYLQMARDRRPPERSPAISPIAAAYFQARDDAEGPSGQHESSPGVVESSAAGDVAEWLDALVELLTAAGMVPGRSRGLLPGATADTSPVAHLRSLMDQLRDGDDPAYDARNHELAFLANTLMAGCSLQGRSLTPQEASDAAASTCNLGLERWPSEWPGVELQERGLVIAFDLGWSTLHADVSTFVATQLIATLAGLRSDDLDIQRELYALRRELTRQRDAGTFWRARRALESIATLDMLAWAGLLGVLDECPVLPAALRATIEGHTGRVSPTAFEFISTTGQIDEVRAFARKLPELLLA